MCEHDDMEKMDVLRDRVELWGCNECDHEEVRIYQDFHHGRYVTA